MTAEPVEESFAFRQLMRARRHRLWRVRPDGGPEVQVRVIVWFEDGTATLLVGGNKAELQELWYEMAAAQAEAEVDAIKRQLGVRWSATEGGRHDEEAE